MANAPFPSGIWPHVYPKVPLSTIPRHPFLADRPQIFSNGAFVFKMYFFEWGVSAKKKHFCHIFSNIFPRCSQFGQNRELMGTWESSENQSDRAIKKEKILENSTVKQTLDPPLLPRSPNHFCKKCNKLSLATQFQSPSSFRCSRYKLSNKKVNNYLSRIYRLVLVISQ